MFTGIVEELGRFVDRRGERHRFASSVVGVGAAVGESIAVNGCCLTVVASGDEWWEADVVAESRARTVLGDLEPGDPVNLERPMRADDRFGGHIVQGHVDGVGEIVSPAPDLRVRVPAEVMPYLVAKGSVTVDGISLTVVDVLEDGFTVALIPHTTAVTTLGHKGAGDRVNLEADVVAKYVERLAVPYRVADPGPAAVPMQRGAP